MRNKAAYQVACPCRIFEPEANQIIESELMASIQQAIDNLPERMKQVVQMHYLEDKSLKEIGQEIGIDPETARSHRYRAIQLLKKTIIPGWAVLRLLYLSYSNKFYNGSPNFFRFRYLNGERFCLP